MTTTIAESEKKQLTGGHFLTRNITWNLLGTVTPTVVAIFCIPILIKRLGTDRFGVLTLAWVLIGYASLFDLGLGRALTQMVASKIGSREDHDVPVIFWTSIVLMTLLGLVGAFVVVGISPWLVHRILKIPIILQQETLNSFYLLGLSIPFVIGTAGLRGFLEARQRFGLINALRIPMGIFNYAGPLLILPFSLSLFPVVAILATGRFIGWLAHLIVCLKDAPALRDGIIWRRSIVGPLLRFGGWMTVTNVVGPIMVTLDRFLIGTILTVSAVAYYATPYELVTELWFIPSAMVGVMFPAFTMSSVQDRDWMAVLFFRSVKYLTLMMFPVILLVEVFAQNGLNLWLGVTFAQNSFRVLQWLAVGVFLNSLAQIPFALIQGVGRPDLTAKLHLIELPAYVTMLWWLTKTHGIEGAAIAWTLRVVVDTVALFVMVRKFLPGRFLLSRKVTLLLAGTLIALALAATLHDFISKGIFLVLMIPGFILVGWFLVLTPEDRSLAQDFL